MKPNTRFTTSLTNILTGPPFFRMSIASLAAVILAGLITLTEAAVKPSASNDTRTLPRLIEPPPLDSRIIEMMKTNVLGSVEARIYFVEKWQITPVQKAQAFFSMLANAEGDDQRKLAHAAVQHVANTNYALVRRQLVDSKLPRVVLSVFMTDTLKRDYQTKLPVVLILAQSAGHPMQAEAQQLLRGYLNCDHGTNWPKWEESMTAWLATNPR